MIDLIENTIQNALKQNFEGFDVEPFPVDFLKYDFTSPKGCLLTRYEKSSMSQQNSVVSVNCDETYSFTVFMALRYLQSHKQANPYIHKLKTVLNGLGVLNKRLKVNEINFEAEDNGDLWYSVPVSIVFGLKDIYNDDSEAGKTIMCKADAETAT